MLDADYITHFKVLGKLAKLYDDASADLTAMELLVSRMWDQAATGESASLPTVEIIAAYATQLRAALTNGATAIQTLAKQIASAYLISSTFRSDLVNATPANTGSAASVLEALQTEMGAASGDDKTLTTRSSTGMVNFFDAIAGSAGTWNTDADVSADYPDSTYVVNTIVA